MICAAEMANKDTHRASFRQCMDEVDEQLNLISLEQDVAYRYHYRGGWHVSVTTGFKCVGLRKWYVVRAVRGDRSEAHEDGYHFAFARMAETQTDHRVPSPRLSRR